MWYTSLPVLLLCVLAGSALQYWTGECHSVCYIYVYVRACVCACVRACVCMMCVCVCVCLVQSFLLKVFHNML